VPRWRKERKRKFFFDPRSRLVQIQDASFAPHRDAEVLRQKQKVQVSHTNAHGTASIYRWGPLTEKGRRASGGGSGTAEEEMTHRAGTAVCPVFPGKCGVEVGWGDGRRRRRGERSGAESDGRDSDVC
jgi:hypothetical protein